MDRLTTSGRHFLGRELCPPESMSDTQAAATWGYGRLTVNTSCLSTTTLDSPPTSPSGWLRPSKATLGLEPYQPSQLKTSRARCLRFHEMSLSTWLENISRTPPRP